MERVGLAVLLLVACSGPAVAQRFELLVFAGGFRPSPTLEHFWSDQVVCDGEPCPSSYHANIDRHAPAVAAQFTLRASERWGVGLAAQIARFGNDVTYSYGSTVGRQDVRQTFVALQPHCFLPLDETLGLELSTGPTLAITHVTTTEPAVFGLIEDGVGLGWGLAATLQAVLSGRFKLEARGGSSWTAGNGLSLAWGIGFAYAFAGRAR